MGTIAGVLALVLLPLPWLPAKAQSPSIEELEQKLQKAKEEKARRDAAAAKARANADAAAKPRTEAAERANARLVVSTDAPCTLAVNGKAMGELRPGAARMVEVSPGQQLVECASAAESTINVRSTPTVNAASQQVVDLRLAGDLERAAREAQKQNQAVQVAQRLVGRWEATKTSTTQAEGGAGNRGCRMSGDMCRDYITCTVRIDMSAWLDIEPDKAGLPHMLNVRYQRANNLVVTGQFEQWLYGKRSSTASTQACSTANYFSDVIGQKRWVRTGSFTAGEGRVADADGPLTTVECSGNCTAESQKAGFRDKAGLRFNGDRIELWFDDAKEAAFSFTRR